MSSATSLHEEIIDDVILKCMGKKDEAEEELIKLREADSGDDTPYVPMSPTYYSPSSPFDYTKSALDVYVPQSPTYHEPRVLSPTKAVPLEQSPGFNKSENNDAATRGGQDDEENKPKPGTSTQALDEDIISATLARFRIAKTLTIPSIFCKPSVMEFYQQIWRWFVDLEQVTNKEQFFNDTVDAYRKLLFGDLTSKAPRFPDVDPTLFARMSKIIGELNSKYHKPRVTFAYNVIDFYDHWTMMRSYCSGDCNCEYDHAKHEQG